MGYTHKHMMMSSDIKTITEHDAVEALKQKDIELNFLDMHETKDKQQQQQDPYCYAVCIYFTPFDPNTKGEQEHPLVLTPFYTNKQDAIKQALEVGGVYDTSEPLKDANGGPIKRILINSNAIV